MLDDPAAIGRAALELARARTGLPPGLDVIAAVATGQLGVIAVATGIAVLVVVTVLEIDLFLKFVVVEGGHQ